MLRKVPETALSVFNSSNSYTSNNCTLLSTAMATGATSQQLDIEENQESNLDRIRTAGSVTISSELFEKLYLNPPSEVKGDFSKRIGNPTPMLDCFTILLPKPSSCADGRI